MRDGKRPQILEKRGSPLSLHHDFQSKLWKEQIVSCRNNDEKSVSWAAQQIVRVIQDHGRAESKNIHEADLLRVAGALARLGVQLSAYLVKG